jgi:hypothetical protein
MVFGVNVSGGRRGPPKGELDVWIPVPTLEKVGKVTAEDARAILKQEFSASEAGKTDCIVRLKTPEAATALVSRVKSWIAGPATS